MGLGSRACWDSAVNSRGGNCKIVLSLRYGKEKIEDLLKLLSGVIWDHCKFRITVNFRWGGRNITQK